MAIGISEMAVGSNTANGTSFATSSVTPTANRLVLLAFVANNTPEEAVSVAGCNLTWVRVASVDGQSAASPSRRLHLYRAMGASPSAGTITVTMTSTHNLYQYKVLEFSNVHTGGINGSAAVVQSATNAADAQTSLTVTLGSFISASNGAFGVFHINANSALTNGSGWTNLNGKGDGSPAAGYLDAEWRADNDTTCDMNNGANSRNWSGIAIEIREASVVIPSRNRSIVIA